MQYISAGLGLGAGGLEAEARRRGGRGLVLFTACHRAAQQQGRLPVREPATAGFAFEEDWSSSTRKSTVL